MIKPRRLRCGDKVAIVSLSWGGLGDKEFFHKFCIAKERLERDFGLDVICMPNALRGSKFVSNNPELRAKDLMDAFRDSSISAIICAIGGDDTIRILRYIDFDIIRDNPKIFMGYSDSTINHLMMYKAGLVSFYGPSIMCEFGEYVEMFDYTKKAVFDSLFSVWDEYEILPSSEWTDEIIMWDERNINVSHNMKKDLRGYEVLSGSKAASGHLLGGCIDVFPMVIGTDIWPSLEQWSGAVLFVETSEEKPSPEYVTWIFRNLAATGILGVLNGIIVGKPQGEVFYEEYKKAIMKVVVDEENLADLPVFYNVNFGHAKPIGIIPYGVDVLLDCDMKRIILKECPVT